jgi:hypothetical protein
LEGNLPGVNKLYYLEIEKTPQTDLLVWQVGMNFAFSLIILISINSLPFFSLIVPEQEPARRSLPRVQTCFSQNTGGGK